MSFSAGFAQGFAKTFISDLEARRERIDKLVDQGISSAKAVAPRYMKAQGEYQNVLEIGNTLKNDFGVTDEEFVALAQGTDVTQLYKTIQQENQNRIAAGRSALMKEDFINIVEMPDSVIPEGLTREQAVAQIMGLQGQALAKEDDPKSEGARTRAGGSGIAEFLALNPKLSAEAQLKAMKIMGYDVSDLDYFQSTGGLKQKVIPGVTRTRDVLFDDINYDKGSYDRTERKYNSRFATRLAGSDISDVDVFRTTTGIPTDVKQAMRDNAMRGSTAMAQLELGIVNSGLGLGLIGPAARRNLLEGIFSEISSGRRGVAQLETLMKNISSGKAVDDIVSIFAEKGRFTAEDYQSIITGVPVQEEEKTTEEGTSADTEDSSSVGKIPVEEQTDSAIPITTEGVEKEKAAPTDDSVVVDLEKQIASEKDPLVKKALQNELTNELLKGSSEQEKAPQTEDSIIVQERESSTNFIKNNSQAILDELESKGLTGESSKEEVKLALTDFYRENQEGPIGDYIAKAPLSDIDMIASVFKLTLENLDKE